jgi:hypothetical protein
VTPRATAFAAARAAKSGEARSKKPLSNCALSSWRGCFDVKGGSGFSAGVIMAEIIVKLLAGDDKKLV